MFRTPNRATPHAEFVALMALMMALVAMSTDIMLPALGHINQDLLTPHPNDRQLIIVILFLGMACGQILWGPLSDSFGRRIAIHCGSIVFMAGCLISIFSQSMEVMLLGRFCQGLGAASARVVTMAMIRDRFSGEQMARVLSVIMSVFILIPMLAPATGQAILGASNWRMIFVAILLYGLVIQVWFFLRQQETLSIDNRHPFTFRTVRDTFLTICRHRTTTFFTLSAAFVFGIFVGYLSFAQQLFQEFYATGDRFALYFAILALSIGIAMFANSLLVSRYGMHRLSLAGLTVLIFVSTILLILTALHGGKPPFAITFGLLFVFFLPIGILFINMNTLAIEPHGKHCNQHSDHSGIFDYRNWNRSSIQCHPLSIFDRGSSIQHTVVRCLLSCHQVVPVTRKTTTLKHQSQFIRRDSQCIGAIENISASNSA